MPEMSNDSRQRRRLRGWMARHSLEYDGPTWLAEACADALDLYENEDWDIPEIVYEIALEFFPDD
jgi:hypothetical protein